MVTPNQRGGFAIGIDLGTSNTVAVVRWPDGRTRPLLFDGQLILPSAVFLDSGGTLHVGRDAVRMAQLDPACFEPNPKRRIDESMVLLGHLELTVVDLLAAPLRLIARTVTETVGFLPPAVLTYPAAWGSNRRQILQDAAARAGWPPVRLVPEPIAAARFFSETLRRPVPPGSALAIFDFGGGTLDVALVRNDGSSYAVVGAGGASDLGGLDVDATLVEHLGTLLVRDQPTAWAQITRPTDELERRHRRVFWDDVRTAKEMLSRTTVAPVAVPGVSHSVHLTRGELEELAGPLIKRAVGELVRTVHDSGLTTANLSGVFLVGGASRIPLVARQLHTELGLAPTVLEQPEMPVAEGALADLAVAEAHRATPSHAPVPSGANPTTLVPSASIPTTMLPASVPTTLVPPAPVPPAPVPPGANPTATFSAQPISGTPFSAMPVSPVPVPAASPPPARRRRRGRKVVAIIAATLLTVGVAALGGWYALFRPTQTSVSLSSEQKILIEDAHDDGYLAAFLTGTKAIAVAQTGRQVEVVVDDLATGQLQRKRVGDAAKWQGVRMAKDMVTITSEAEPSGLRQLIGVSVDLQHSWTMNVKKDDLLGIDDAHGRESSYLWWIERASGEIKKINLDGRTETFRDHPKVPAGSELLNRAGEVEYPLFFRTPQGSILEYPGDGLPVTEIRDRPFGTFIKPGNPNLYVTDQVDGLVVMNIVDLGEPYSIESSTTGSNITGPDGRIPFWIGHCDLAICLIDEVPNNPNSRELTIYEHGSNTNLGKVRSRDKMPYADPALAVPAVTTANGQYLVVSTRRDGKPGAIVINMMDQGLNAAGSDHIVGSYGGYLIPAGRDRGVLFAGDSVGDPAKADATEISGVDFKGRHQTRLISTLPTLRPVKCASNGTHLLCTGANDFTLWRFSG